MTDWWVIPEDFPVLSDLTSSVQPSTQPQWVRSSSSWVSLSWNQYNEMMIRIHELENVRRPSQMTGPNQMTQRLASVLNPHSFSSKAVHFLAPQSVTVTHRFASVLNPHLRCEVIPLMTPPPSVTVISTLSEKDKMKANPPSTFTSSDDIQIWILEVNDYFNLCRITDSTAQATVACFYLSEIICQQMQCLQLTEDVESFSTWERLQTWLMINYSISDVRLETDLVMNRIQMKLKKMVQSFINQFEIIVTDLNWNEPAVTAAFWRKLNADISEMIHFLRPADWSKTFTDFKQVTQQAENHLCIGKRDQEDHPAESLSKQLRFELPQNWNERHWDDCEAQKPSSFWECAANISVTALNSLSVSEKARAQSKEKRHCREQRMCLNCEGAGHWSDKCTASCNLFRETSSSKNA